ncbi:MAG: nicotinate-nucleotide adenylyltransferase [Tatlockia sp.]|nr:nicotinate-nucleotide adenylyltransferase [Tatlockia sp.]
MHNLLIYGGTFDPVHNGHIQTAVNVQKQFDFERFIFLPCKIPVLKNQALATASQRVKMIELALAPLSQHSFEINLSEINRNTPSYMVESLEYFRNKLGVNISITLLMGRDTFNQLPSWYQWTKLLKLTNLLVIKRPGYKEFTETEELRELIQNHETFVLDEIKKQRHGLIYSYDAGTYNFSSTWIREQIHEKNELKAYLSDSVIDYIRQNNLYSEVISGQA